MLRNRRLRSALFSTVLLATSILVFTSLHIRKNENVQFIATPFVMDKTEKVEPNENVTPPEEDGEKKDEAHSLSSVEDTFRLYDGVETFVLFIGYPRSSHSLVGAVLDAHPEVVIPHEYNLLAQWSKYQRAITRKRNLQKYVLYHVLQSESKRQALYGIRANNSLVTGKYTYTYNVPGLWQGGYYKRIKVIGDKKGGTTSGMLTDPSKWTILEEIRDVVQVPVKFIHVNRNPFDNIATMTLRRLHQRDQVRNTDTQKVNNTRLLEGMTNVYFRLAKTNQRIRERYGDAVIDIPGHETVLRPKETMQKLCDHLGVTCSEDYLEKCSKIMYGTPSVTRDKVVWPEELKSRVTERMQNYPFLKDYSFDEYPS